MERDLKFRIWDLRRKEFFKPIYKAFEGNLYDLSITTHGQISIRTIECASDMRNQDFIIMQYTGLKDKNGKEIYEGDILAVHIFTQELGEGLGVREGEKQFKAEICYQEMGLWLQGNTEDESGYILWYDGVHEESFEIIGNIHENPELLNTSA